MLVSTSISIPQAGENKGLNGSWIMGNWHEKSCKR